MQVFRGNQETEVGKEPAQVKVLEDGGERRGGKQVAHPPVPRDLGTALAFLVPEDTLWILQRKEYY